MIAFENYMTYSSQNLFSPLTFGFYRYRVTRCTILIIEDYLKNGSLECLDVLPSVTYASIAEQIDSILGSMED